MSRTLTPVIEHELASLASSWSAVEVVVLFGSAATGRLGAESDVDLYVRLRRGAARERSDEESFLARASATCRREIDLVVESPSTSVILRREVAAKGRMLFERRPGAFRELVVDAVHAYVDLEPYLRRMGAAIRARAVTEGAAAAARLAAVEVHRGR